jgi:NAD(P)H-hydrate epimerase
MYEYLVTAQEMRAFDDSAINIFGIPGVVLMENAGRATFIEIQKHCKSKLKGLKVAVVAGPGNNGGDGFVIARYLINHGAKVTTYLLAPRNKVRGDALINLRILDLMGASIEEVEDSESLFRVSEFWKECGLIVDAILGTGLQSDVRSPVREAILLINECPGYKVSVDVPSGVNSDSGGIQGFAVNADLTVTYGFRKLGMTVYPGKQVCGNVQVIDISIPKAISERNPPLARYVNYPDINAYFDLRRKPVAHKGTFGHVLVIGGSPGKTGAPVMAARAASRIGAGLVTLAIPEALNQTLENKLTEEMTAPVGSDNRGHWNKDSSRDILELIPGKDCIVIGPGLSTTEFAQEIVEMILLESTCPLVVDADAINCLINKTDILGRARNDTVLTPHPGEMARLTGMPTGKIQADRVTIARTFARNNNLWLTLKGAATVSASPQGEIFVNSSGSPWMASGGQGDALSGILGGLLAQGMEPLSAVPLGVFIHGSIADRMIADNRLRPVSAMDLIDGIPQYLSELASA